ncbi:tRNA (guanine(10)-N2)-methyltransferase homolog [Oppia nitens]|uniref:tRNA (guanine(10)-N2)-methyltransferase homolog n=1 Tax=Oppia nitens TaxID=1686743 RepID=UPI0023D9C989|nr:tRNA (guanine(10)-N2)-methyltransferase homolog [Oppia nitens]
MSEYLLWFANQYNDFRVSEFESLCSLLAIDFLYSEQPSDKPFIIFRSNATDRQLKQLMSRTVLARNIYELWINSDQLTKFYDDLRQCPRCRLPQYRNSSFRIYVDAYNKKLSLADKIEKIETIGFLPFEGPIDLRTPDHSFHLFEYYGSDSNIIPEEPIQILFGRHLYKSNRKVCAKLSLKTRKFIANTSMEPLLGLLMTNIARITANDLVLDPFVGSGSLLVAAAYCGAYVFGTDIDYKLIHGLTKPSRAGVKQRDEDESILANLKQYGLQDKYIDVVAADASLPIWRKEKRLSIDAIITDPPYGKRESRERIGTEKQYKIPDELIDGHIPAKVEYNLCDIFSDLLSFSAFHLKIGGRLVFWVPLDKQNNKTNFDITTDCHPCLKVISISEQQLSTYMSRILICVEKFREEELEEYSEVIVVNNREDVH